jgi:4-aminobutyrate aminotransferase-like enzyme
VTTADALKSLERIFKADIAPDQVAAIILEPIQGKAALTSRRPILCRRCATCAIPTAFC